MAKITFDNIASGYASTTTLNNNFDAIEAELNNKVLYRDNPNGEPNTMDSDLDMNENDILNVGSLNVDAFLVNGVDYIESMNTVYNNYLAITQQVTVSTASPSGGEDGDIWFKVSS